MQCSLWRNFSLSNFKRTLSKMTKSINKHQIDILVSLMQGQPEIARGFYKGSKDALTRFWRNAEEELNSAGPPTKCIAEWKKVWGDQKRYVRHKAANNMKHAKGTGGGPNRQYKLSPTEVAIYELIGMQETVEGVAKKFGLPQPPTDGNIAASGTSSASNKQSNENIKLNECEIIECDVVNEVEIVGEYVMDESSVIDERARVSVVDTVGECMVDESRVINERASVSVVETVGECMVDESGVNDKRASVSVEERPMSSRKAKQKKIHSDVLEEELSIQREMCGLMKKKLQEAEKQTKIMKKTYALKKKHFKEMQKLKKEKLELIKRQTLIMEKNMTCQLQK